MTELLSPMVVMSEGLGFNLCVAPFLNVCVLNLSWRVGAEDVRGGRSWVRGVVLVSYGRGPRLNHSGIEMDISETGNVGTKGETRGTGTNRGVSEM